MGRNVTSVEASSTKGACRRDEIVSAARKLFELRGIGRTSVKDITESLGVTRGLFYYYFDDKNDIVVAVIDEYAADCASEVHAWNESRPKDSTVESLRGAIVLLRHMFVEADVFKRSLDIAENTAIYDTFVDHAISEVVSSLLETVGSDPAVRHVSNPSDTLYMLIYGLAGLLKKDPSIDDETIMRVLSGILLAGAR